MDGGRITRARSERPVNRHPQTSRRGATADVVSALVVTAPGLAPLAAGELATLGIEPVAVRPEGVTIEAPMRAIYTANLWLRTASRIVVRAGSFHADSFHELERRARRLPWGEYVDPAAPVRIRVTCRKSRLFHSDAVAERIAEAVERAGGRIAAPAGAAASDADDDRREPCETEQLVVVRLRRDECTISVDSSGALLHRRGYRQQTAKAPLRESLAAAVLLASGWRAQAPLLDPLCGSGTIAIEAAWLARRRAPGRDRRFAFMRWPGFDPSAWADAVADARAGERTASPVAIHASDRDAGAVGAARDNAARAGVEADLVIEQRPLADVVPPTGIGWLVTNPPYGVRVGPPGALRALYASIGTTARARCIGWTVALVTADRALARATGLPLRSRLRTVNGGIPVELATAVVEAARLREPALPPLTGLGDDP